MPLWRPRRRRKVTTGTILGQMPLVGGSAAVFTGVALSSGSNALRVGLMDMEQHIGEGPGGSTSNPYRVVMINPHALGLSNLPAAIAQAQAADIVLVCYMPGGPNTFMTAGAFDLNKYKQRLDLLLGIPEFNAAIASKRCLAYGADEPNRDIWNGTFTPTLLNQCGVEIKQRWNNCLTFVRIRPTDMNNGWNGNLKPAGGYTGIDYGWMQFNSSRRAAGLTVGTALAAEKAVGATLSMGVVVSLNMVNGGLRTDLDGVTACWNHDLSGATPIGVVIGHPADPGFTDGQLVPCPNVGTIANAAELLTSPAWIRRVADVTKDDNTVPFLLYWAYPDVASGSDQVSLFYNRSDGIQAFTDAMDLGLQRVSWNGYRTPKGPPF